MQREIQVTMTLVVEDFDESEIMEAMDRDGLDADEMAGTEDIELFDIKDSIESIFESEELTNEYFWAGSGIYAKIASCKVTNIDG